MIDSYIIKNIFTLAQNEMQSQKIRSTLLVFLSVLSFVYFLQWLLKMILEIRKLPPGPWGLPIFGILSFIGSEKHLKFLRLSKIYGKLFSARLGQQLTVVIADYKLIREAFKKEEYTARPKTPIYSILNGFGVINAEGNLWKSQRKFLHEKLSLGIRSKRSGLEKLISNEVMDFLNVIRDSNSNQIDMSPILSVNISNVICNLLMSIKFTQNDSRFERFTALIEEGFVLFGKINTIDYFPFLQHLPNTRSSKAKIAQNRLEMFNFYKEVIDEHRATFDPNNLRDLVDAYLFEIKKAEEGGYKDQLFYGKDSEEQLMQVIGDIFSAGMETIKTTLLWHLVFMLRYPEQMQKIQDELNLVVGRDRLPNYQDMPYLPVTESTICEVLRISTIIPLGTTHSNYKDVDLAGFQIPAHSHIVPLINAVHMDKTLWNPNNIPELDPNNFNPSRFINEAGKVWKPEYFLPFGVGRRMCLGDSLAKMELFLFFSALMHTFSLKLPEGQEMPDTRGITGVTIAPNKFKVCMIPRPLNVDDASTPLRNLGSK